MKKTTCLMALAGGLMLGCGGSSTQSLGTFGAAASAPTPATLFPPALPARIVSATDPEGEDNDDVSSPDDLTFDVPLKAGWNAVALRVDLVTQVVAPPEILGFTTYEEGEFLDPEPLTTSTLNRGEGSSLGFFVFAAKDTVLRYRGTPPAGLELAGLEPGWNLVAPPAARLQELDLTGLTIYGVGENGQPTLAGDVLEPGKPLWVYTASELEWRLPHRPSATVALNPTGSASSQSRLDYPEPKIVCDRPEDESGGVRPLAFYRGSRWTPGQTINVLFLDGNDIDPKYCDEATRLVQETWGANTSLQFHFFRGDGEPGETYHITVKFLADKGWNSRLGRWSQQYKPSMYLSRLHHWPIDSAVFKRVVIHEFGHALGAVHEHQNPNVNIQWNREAVYAAMARPPGRWTRATTENAYFNTMPSDLYSEFDDKSIMLYQIPKEWTTDGFFSPYISKLSEMDAEWARQAYP
ncbi:hypothetical protein ABS71_03510 [bacterium SCN 62-11]|nr:hypothetical protein [Candidatus Eremiobacteraeota bacterium]ODT76380.1 MAG: hypothetical protein ABS71_03510 [bacterium SCN 62-11]